MSDKPDKKLESLEDSSVHVKISRDFFLGAVAVKNKTYLPLWVGESEEAYKVRLKGTSFTNLYAPIIAGIGGMVLKEEPIVEGFDKINLGDIDGNGNSFPVFLNNVLVSSLVGGVEFVAVQSNDDDSVFLKRYLIEDLYSYQHEGEKLTQIVFRDIIEVKSGIFGLEERERFIVFRDGGGDIWYDDGSGLKIQSGWNNSLEEVPVVGIVTGKQKNKYDVLPRFFDIADLSNVILEYESCIGNVVGVVGNPIAVFYGETNDDGDLTIGARDAIVFSDKTKEGFEYVEVTGAGVTVIESSIKRVSETIDKLSFSAIQKSQSRTVVDAEEGQSKNTSMLTVVAHELDSKFNLLFKWYYEVSNETKSEKDTLVFNKKFDLFTDKQMQLLLSLLNSGDLSRETLWARMKTSGTLPKEFDALIEKERIEQEGGEENG